MTESAPRISLQDLLLAIDRQWVDTPDKIALKDGDTRLTYAMLDARANFVARRLLEHGGKPGDFIGYLGPMGAPFVVTFLACLKAGLTFLPISPRFSGKNVALVLETVGARLFMTDRPPPETAAGLRLLGIPGDEMDPEPCLDLRVPGSVLGVATSTSGSTGIPKIVGKSRDGLVAVTQAEIPLVGLGPHSVAGHAGTMWVVSLLSALSAGAMVTCLDVTSGTDRDLMTWLAEDKVTYWFTYPALFRTLSGTTGQLPDLQSLLLCGEPLFRADFQQFERMTQPGAALFNVLGQQEFNWSVAYRIRNGESLKRERLPVGTPLGDTEVQLRDAKGRPVGAGEIGEIHYRSFRVAGAYIGDPERSAKVFFVDPDGMRRFASGDLGYVDVEGNLNIVGRKDDQVKIRGFNVLPADIEQEIKPHAHVDEVAVTVNRCARGLPRLVCFYTGPATPEDLKTWLSTRIPAFMIPQFFVPLAALPRTATGKLQRNRLTLPETLSGIDHVAPQTDAERALAEIWQQVLGHADFGVTDNFFDVGGDSLRAMELVLHVETRFQRLVTLDQLVLSGATIRDLAALLAAPAARSELRVLKPGEGGQHLVLAHVHGGGLGDYLEFSRVIGDGIRVSGVSADYSRRSRAYPRRKKAREAFAVIPKEPPPVLMGFSFGAMMAFEIAHCFDTPQRLILIDPVGPFNESLKLRLVSQAKSLVMRSPGLGRERSYWLDFWYRPRRLAVANALLVTCDSSFPADVLGWRAALDGPVEEFRVAGSHFDIFKSSNVREIAGKVQEWMARTAL